MVNKQKTTAAADMVVLDGSSFLLFSASGRIAWDRQTVHQFDLGTVSAPARKQSRRVLHCVDTFNEKNQWKQASNAPSVTARWLSKFRWAAATQAMAGAHDHPDGYAMAEVAMTLIHPVAQELTSTAGPRRS